MKILRTIALLALSILALRGEAASALGGLSLPLPIDLPDIIGGRTPGGPGIDRDAYEQRADQVVNYSLNIKGLDDASASVYIIGFEPYPDEYQWILENATSPAYGNLFMGNATGDQTLTAVEQLGTPEINDINNWYCEIFIDADNYMISRLGESPDYSLVFDHVGDWHGYEEMTIYNLTASITYENGYISPYHEGPDPLPTPEPTSGLLLLIGLSGLALRRRHSDQHLQYPCSTSTSDFDLLPHFLTSLTSPLPHFPISSFSHSHIPTFPHYIRSHATPTASVSPRLRSSTPSNSRGSSAVSSP